MQGKFVILKDGKISEYDNFLKIPHVFENLIAFEPIYPEEPHTEEEHDLIATYNDKLKELLKRETR